MEKIYILGWESIVIEKVNVRSECDRLSNSGFSMLGHMHGSGTNMSCCTNPNVVGTSAGCWHIQIRQVALHPCWHIQ